MSKQSLGGNTEPVVFAFEKQDPRDRSLDWLRERGVQIRYGSAATDPTFRRYEPADFVRQAQGCVGVLGSSSIQITEELLASLDGLRFISKLGIGVDSIDITAATRRGILVTNTPDPDASIAVAEHAVAMMLALCKRLNHWTPAYLREGGWRGSDVSTSIAGLTVGIVGLGRIGQAVAQRLANWDVRLVGYDPYAGDAGHVAERMSLNELFSVSDIVTLHCTATPENHHIVNARTLALMKPNAFLINTGRGALIDQAALRHFLREGKIAGAGLDVFEQEPPDPHDHLLSLDNVIATPHVASRTLRALLDARTRAANNMWAMLTGSDVADIVNPEAKSVGGAQ